MNFGPKNTSGSGGKNRRRRRRGGRPGQAKGQPGQGQGHSGQRGHRNSGAGIFTHPMDHSYRNAGQSGGNQHGRRGVALPSAYVHPETEPVPHHEGPPRIFCFIEDLFFLAKIQETARKLNVKVEFVKTDKDLLDRLASNGDEKPSLIIFDLNNASAKPLSTIPKLRRELKKDTTIIGFLSHVQGDLKVKAMEAGANMVIPRSAFSQNLPQLLRRHGTPEDLLDTQ